MSQQPQQQGESLQAPRTSGMAVASLVVSILGLIQVLPLIGAIAGIAMGYMARAQIRDSGGAVGGEGLATGGIVVGWLAVALTVAGICIFVLFWAGLLSLPVGIGLCGGLGNAY
jgi:hypothetical protein